MDDGLVKTLERNKDDENDFIVAKFGGSSVANAEQISKVEKIIREDSRRKFIVVSAPGKDKSFKYKITDILYNLYFKVNKFKTPEFPNYEIINEPFDYLQDVLVQRYGNLSTDLGLSGNVIDELKERISVKRITESSEGRIVSFGEYFSAKIIAEHLGAEFIDAAGLIKMRRNGSVIMHNTLDNIREISGGKLSVIPGFYGSVLGSDDILTFSRGGSDFTGSIIAAGVNASLYENWTDRDGIYSVDPRLFDEKELESKSLNIIKKMSYKETRELTYMGFEVFNDESLGPLFENKIPLLIKNTNNPSAPGTLISDEYDSMPVRGIAGKNGFCSITVEKYLMNKTVGFGARLLSILSDYGINYEHSPSGIDSMSVVLEQKPFERYKRDILGDINSQLSPDSVNVKEHLGLVAVVGEGMKNNVLIASRIMGTLSAQKIKTEIISQGASENNIILGVNACDYKRAIKSLYASLIEEK